MSLVSVIIPTYNEENQIAGTLRHVLAMAGHFEVIVVDGGSTDQTLSIVSSFKEVCCFQTPQAGRAEQMNLGAQRARGESLLFLHADTLPHWNSINLIADAMDDPTIAGGSFALEFDRNDWHYRLLSRFTRLNSPLWTFGDQGIFVRASVFDSINGYAAIPILEDLDLQRRLRRQGTFVKLPVAVRTSARRYTHNNTIRELGLDLAVLCGYFLGFDPHQLYRWYTYPSRRSRAQLDTIPEPVHSS